MLRAWRRAAAAFQNADKGRLLLAVNTSCSGILMATGDCIEQSVEIHRGTHEKYDWTRTGRMFIVGIIQGAPQHWFYVYLDKWWPGTKISTIGKKIFIDQLIASPFCIILFFTGMNLMEKKSLKDCTDELNEKFTTVYITDWCVWPPTQFINFYFLPIQYRVIYVNAMTMLYNIFLSYIKHKDTNIKI